MPTYELTPAFALLDGLVDPIFVIDRNWRFLHLNTAALDKAQKPLEALVGTSLWSEYPQLIGTEWEALYRDVMCRRVVRQVELPAALSSAWYNVSVSPSGDGIMVSVQDITKRREILEALRASEERYRRLMENSSDAIWTTKGTSATSTRQPSSSSAIRARSSPT